MLVSIRAELFRLVRRKSSWLSIGALALLPLLLGLVFRLSTVTAAGPAGSEPVRISGYGLLMLTMSTAMAIFAPLVSAFASAELLAREIKEGTVKLSLMRPVSRAQVLLAKCLACLAHNATLVAALWLVALSAGGVLFGYGPPDQSMSAFVGISSPGGEGTAVGQVAMGGISSQGEALLRLGASYAYLILSLTVVGLLALFLSTLIANQAGAIVATLAAIIGMGVLGSVQGIRPYLLSTHLVSGSLLAQEIDWAGLGSSLAVLAGYAVALVVAATLIFRRRDILT